MPQDPRVLIVDDDPVIQLLLRVNFEMDGFEVSSAYDGEQGLAMALELVPDVVLLDVMMPKLDGFQVLKALRAEEKTKDLPIALLSAKSLDSDRQAGLEAGANVYITKPFNPRDLLAEVKELVARSGDGQPAS